MISVRLWSERGLIQGIDHVPDVKSVLARHRLDVTVITNGPVMQAFKNRNSFRMTLLYITNDHVTTDELIESKHRLASNQNNGASRWPKDDPLFSIIWPPERRDGG